MAGRGIRLGQDRARLLERRNITLEIERESASAQAVAEERLRIARELHDVVAHGISLIVVQARGGRRVARRRPEEAVDAFDTIEHAGQQALGEMRRLLGMLRADDDEPALAPQPSLGRLPDLIRSVAAAGLEVEMVVEGDARELPPGIDVSAYRIVQEALTNALRHAGVGTARLIVRYGPESLDIEVLDEGAGTGTGADHGAVHGLIGRPLRRRAPGGGASGGGLCPASAPTARGEPMTRVFLADDQGLVRGGFRRILDDEPDIEVVGEAGDGEEAVQRAEALAPDVVLMDIRMPPSTASRRPAGSWSASRGRACWY